MRGARVRVKLPRRPYTSGDHEAGLKMSAADKRISELLDRWLASVELHSSYLELDDAEYAKAQDWPRHQRPTRWILDLARARLNELRRQVADHEASGDTAFAESLELMSFLTTLLGSEHVERFIPLAASAPRESTQAAPAPVIETPAPALEPTVIRPRAAKAPAARAKTARPEKPPRPDKRASTVIAEKPPKPEKVASPVIAEKPPKPDKVASTVIADAARLLSWGREWPQLAGLIARLADRPPEQEVWAILRTHRAAIEARARRIPD
jgi:hypothetical protein